MCYVPRARARHFTYILRTVFRSGCFHTHLQRGKRRSVARGPAGLSATAERHVPLTPKLALVGVVLHLELHVCPRSSLGGTAAHTPTEPCMC